LENGEIWRMEKEYPVADLALLLTSKIGTDSAKVFIVREDLHGTEYKVVIKNDG